MITCLVVEVQVPGLPVGGGLDVVLRARDLEVVAERRRRPCRGRAVAAGRQHHHRERKKKRARPRTPPRPRRHRLRAGGDGGSSRRPISCGLLLAGSGRCCLRERGSRAKHKAEHAARLIMCRQSDGVERVCLG